MLSELFNATFVTAGEVLTRVRGAWSSFRTQRFGGM